MKALARGEVENDGGVLVIKRIHVEFTLVAPESGRSAVERVHKAFAERCPVYRSVKAAIQITTSFHLVETAS